MPIISGKILFKEFLSLLNFSPCLAFKMIWTLQLIGIFMALTCDVSTLSLRRIRQDHDLGIGIDQVLPKFTSEELSTNIDNIKVYQESTSPKNDSQMYTEYINNSSQNGDGISIQFTHSIENNLALNNEYNITDVPDKNKDGISEFNDNYKSTGKLHDVQNDKSQLLRARSQAVRIQTNGLFKSIGGSIENHSIISNHQIFGMKIKKYTSGNSNNYPWKSNDNEEFYKLFPKMKIGESDYAQPETSAEVKILPHQNNNFTHMKTSQLPFLNFTNMDKQEPVILINSSMDRVHLNNDLITYRRVFPEENYFQDVLASVQREGFLGFPKGKNQQFILKKNIQSTINTYNHSMETYVDLNPMITTEEYDVNIESDTTTHGYAQNDENHFTTGIFTEPPLKLVDEIKKVKPLATPELIKRSSIIKMETTPVIPTEKNNNNNVELQSTINTEVYLQNEGNSFKTEIPAEPPVWFVDEIEETQVSTPQKHGKSSYATETVTLQKKLENEHYLSKASADQNKEDEMRIKNAKYKFSTSQNDGISDLLHERTETRQDGKVTGSYIYSDGFVLKKVNYVADKNGYRIISEDTVRLPGNGPKFNPDGTADIKTDIGGRPLHYMIHGRELPQKTSRF